MSTTPALITGLGHLVVALLAAVCVLDRNGRINKIWNKQVNDVDSDAQVSALSYATLPYAPPLTNVEQEWKVARAATSSEPTEVAAVATEAAQVDPASPEVNEAIIPDHEDVPAPIEAAINPQPRSFTVNRGSW